MQHNMHHINDTLITRSLTKADYVATHEAMLARTLERIDFKKQHLPRTPDELWIVDHNDVYTLGQASKKEHILQHTHTPIIQTDRGGQITWHGTGQLVLYWLFDLDSLGWSVRNLVSHAEQALEDVLNDCLASIASQNHISARSRRDAPGVYLYDHRTDFEDTTELDNIMLGKIASLGFKIKRGFSYHGIALNLDCDLSAFSAINPCGYAGMQMLRLADFVNMQNLVSYEQVTHKLVDNIAKRHAGLITLRPISPKV